MADPFSAIAGALSVGDVCVRVGKYLKDVQRKTKNVDVEIQTLEAEVETFKNTYAALANLCSTGTAQPQTELHAPQGIDDPCSLLWARAAALVKEGHDLIERLNGILIEVLGTVSSPKYQKIEDVRRGMRLSSRGREYDKLHSRFNHINLELGTMLAAINLTSNALFRSDTIRSLEQLPWRLSQELQVLGLQLKTQIKALEEKNEPKLQPSIVSAKAASSFASLNEHFYVQRPDTSIWTGREAYLARIRDALLNFQSATERTQKRFVVQGISGAGKTQLCCKFAQDARESFWGIFWLDASSDQHAAESWKRIAKIGGKDANAEAGKYWLSNLQSPWLLIVDSADYSEESTRSQFPSGDRGCILITTRNPRQRINSTVGFVTLDKLEEDEADELLRKATSHQPWDGTARMSASSIAKHLGYLPLALIHAGRAIYHQLCTLHGYIPFFNRALEEYRSKKLAGTSDEEDNDAMGAFTTFDIIYSGLEAQTIRRKALSGASRDAIELINIFAYLHWNDISLAIFPRAGNNTRDLPKALVAAVLSSEGSSVLQRLKSYVTEKYVRYRLPSPVLPQILRIAEDQPFNEARARKAMDLLVQMSLLSESSESGSYCMHPLVHRWVRKRLGTSEQMLWCEVAGDLIASSVKIPPLEDETGDPDFCVRLMPHVVHVRERKSELQQRLWRNRQAAGLLRSWMISGTSPPPRRMEVFNMLKYSRVYLEAFQFEEAERIQRTALERVTKRLGPENPLTVMVSMGLAKTLWFLARPAEAESLQEEALIACRKVFGKDHPETLKAMDALGETYWQLGKLKEAKPLHEKAIEGMQGKPLLLRNRLQAIVHLGHVHEWYTNFDKACELQSEATDEFTKAFGANDFDTLVAKDSLAMALLQVESVENLKRAHSLMRDVYERRFKTLGEEHLFTLWAACNLARTLTARGILEPDQSFISEAKLIYHDGLEITKRNLGADHVGTLMGRGFRGEALVAEKAYDEAEREFKDIAERSRTLPGSRNGTHRDRLFTLFRLVKCYEEQTRYEEALQLCNTIIEELDGLGGQQHPWRVKVVDKMASLQSHIGSSNSDVDSVGSPQTFGTPELY